MISSANRPSLLPVANHHNLILAPSSILRATSAPVFLPGVRDSTQEACVAARSLVFGGSYISGPVPKIQKQFRAIRDLPKATQDHIARVIDALLAQEGGRRLTFVYAVRRGFAGVWLLSCS